ncbi:hypothetical protein KSD_04680 [Ktedonobacter sp. SOSP1-85]|nr:hypothetical protein [Ktedonobacter sp. SOSP1-85]GHO72697.1 hypothetical protein KSD_04680 [Ktedonobacter sp. SOSP1-85]
MSIKLSNNRRSLNCTVVSQPNQTCPVGRGIQPALKRFYEDGERTLQQQFAQATVADVLRETLTPSS